MLQACSTFFLLNESLLHLDCEMCTGENVPVKFASDHNGNTPEGNMEVLEPLTRCCASTKTGRQCCRKTQMFRMFEWKFITPNIKFGRCRTMPCALVRMSQWNVPQIIWEYTTEEHEHGGAGTVNKMLCHNTERKAVLPQNTEHFHALLAARAYAVVTCVFSCYWTSKMMKTTL